jgi:hypothetical protein
MPAFVCPECYLEVRPHACFVSRGKTWWSVSPAEASIYANICPQRELWPTGPILGCPSMRSAIDRWLAGDAGHAAVRFGAGEVSIADVAAASHVIEQRAECPVPIPPVIADSFRDTDVRTDFAANPGAIEVRSFDLRDVVLVASRMILFKDGERIAETRYIVGDRDYWIMPPAPRALREIGGDKTVVIGINLAFRNYYHWLMQSLPAIEYSVRRVGIENSVLALPSLAEWQEESLTMLGFGEVPRVQIEFDCHYHFENAHWCGYLNGATERFLSPLCLDVLDRMATHVAAIPEAPERIYVARMDTKNRVISNEPAMRRLLEGLGFVTVVPGWCSFATQIGLFKSARVIVGAHGAGLTNLAFCQPGTIVLELVQSAYSETLMNRIAQAKGLNYHAECFESASDGDVRLNPWAVDLKQLETKLLTLL